MDNFIPGSRVKVILPYQSQYPDVITVRIGDRLTAGHRDMEWPGIEGKPGKQVEAVWSILPGIFDPGV